MVLGIVKSYVPRDFEDVELTTRFQLIELKNGQTYNGVLVNSDAWMNLNLRNVVCTSKDGDKFWKIPSCYVRGNTIKYLCMPQEVLSKVPDEAEQKYTYTRTRGSRKRGGNRGGRGGRSNGGNRGKQYKPANK